MSLDQGGPVVQAVQETAPPAPPHHPNEEPPAEMNGAAGPGGLGPVQAGGPGESPTPDWGGPGGPGTSSNLSRGREVEREYELPGPGGPPWTDALGFIDQTIYANEDSGPRVTWRNAEVLELLAEIRRMLVPDLVDLAVRIDGTPTRFSG